jgi:hypothetical protein
VRSLRLWQTRFERIIPRVLFEKTREETASESFSELMEFTFRLFAIPWPPLVSTVSVILVLNMLNTLVVFDDPYRRDVYKCASMIYSLLVILVSGILRSIRMTYFKFDEHPIVWSKLGIIAYLLASWGWIYPLLECRAGLDASTTFVFISAACIGMSLTWAGGLIDVFGYLILLSCICCFEMLNK